MNSHRYDRQSFLDEFFPDAADQAEIAVGVEQLRAEQRAYRLAESGGSPSSSVTSGSPSPSSDRRTRPEPL